MTLRALTSIGYSFGQLGLGLFLHPYQTMQSLVEDKVFIWMSLFPTLILAVVTISWRVGVVPAVRTVFSCQETGFLACNYLEFASNWITFYCVYWQVLLLYLLFRFQFVWKDA